jgi:hypothetical protein
MAEVHQARGVSLTLPQVATAHSSMMYMVHTLHGILGLRPPGTAGVGEPQRCQKLTYAKGKVSITFPRCSNGREQRPGKAQRPAN